MDYPFSVDYFVRLVTRYRIPSAALLFTLCILHNSTIAVVMGLLYLGIELFVLVNRISKLPSMPLPPLSTNDVGMVTGGLRGLGLELVKTLVFKYKLPRVFILDIVEPTVDLGDAVHYIHCDLASEKDVDAALREIDANCKKLGLPLSVVVNNAGIRVNGSLLNLPQKEIQKVFDVNTFAPVKILQHVISGHVKHHVSKRLSVVTVSSVLGAFGAKNLLAYSASKAASTQFHEVLSRELIAYPAIRMLLVAPGQTNTEMFLEVEETRAFVAPIVDHVALARLVLEKVNIGEEGIMCEPFYANFGLMLKSLPWKLQLWAREFSQMDEKIHA